MAPLRKGIPGKGWISTQTLILTMCAPRFRIFRSLAESDIRLHSGAKMTLQRKLTLSPRISLMALWQCLGMGAAARTHSVAERGEEEGILMIPLSVSFR